MIQKMMTSEDTGNRGSTTISSVNVSPELLAEAMLAASYNSMPPKEALDELIRLVEEGSVAASLLLAQHKYGLSLTDSVAEAINKNIAEGIMAHHVGALLYGGTNMISSMDVESIKKGLRLLKQLGKAGIVPAYWFMALYYSQQKSPLASIYLEKAKESGYGPALHTFEYGKAVTAVQEGQLSLRHSHDLHFLQQEVRTLKSRIEEQQAARQTETSNLASQISQWRKLHEDAEARLKALTAEAIRKDYISGQDQKISILENQLLETQIAQEDAEASKLKAERLVDDLTRQNKFYKTLLRKKGIPFTDPSSSSSTEEQP